MFPLILLEDTKEEKKHPVVPSRISAAASAPSPKPSSCCSSKMKLGEEAMKKAVLTENYNKFMQQCKKRRRLDANKSCPKKTDVPKTVQAPPAVLQKHRDLDRDIEILIEKLFASSDDDDDDDDDDVDELDPRADGKRKWTHARPPRMDGRKSSRLPRKADSKRPPGEMPREPGFKSVDPAGYLDGISRQSLNVTFMQHQRRLIQRMAGCRGLVAWWYMGSGKTLGAIGSALMLLEMRAVKDVFIAVPPCMLRTWSDLVEKVFDESQRVYITVTTHRRGLVGPKDAEKRRLASPKVTRDTFLIVDEAHNAKKAVNERDHSKGTCMGDALLRVAGAAGRVLLLSGTPIVNSLTDLNNLAGALRGLPWDWTRWHFRKRRRGGLDGEGALEELRHRVDLFLPTPEQKVALLSMPREVRHRVEMIMDDKYKKYYESFEDVELVADASALRTVLDEEEEEDDEHHTKAFRRKPNAFYSKTRRVTNGVLASSQVASSPAAPLSAKQEWLQQHAAKWVGEGKKFIVYTAWKAMGVGLIARVLGVITDGFDVIDGSVAADERAKIVSNYNSNKISCIVFTAAGAEGIDLKETSHIVLFDTAWTGARLEQALARGIRARSHDAWPEDDRVVHVHQLVLRRAERTEQEKAAIVNDEEIPKRLLDDLSADERLCRYVAEKASLVDQAKAFWAAAAAAPYVNV